MAEQGGGSVFGELNPLSEIRLPAPGSGLELQIEHLQMLAHNDPERVSEVIKHWIGRNERSHEPA
ncbi:flagellar MS-ring protein [compost metagenome]